MQAVAGGKRNGWHSSDPVPSRQHCYDISGAKKGACMLESYTHIAPYDAAAMHAASGTHGVTHEGM